VTDNEIFINKVEALKKKGVKRTVIASKIAMKYDRLNNILRGQATATLIDLEKLNKAFSDKKTRS